MSQHYETRIWAGDLGQIVSTVDMVTDIGPSRCDPLNQHGVTREQISKHVLNTQDTRVREILVRQGWTPPSSRLKCIVDGCSNHKSEGSFVGDLCSPCYSMLSLGDAAGAIHGDTFIHRMRAKIALYQRTPVTVIINRRKVDRRDSTIRIYALSPDARIKTLERRVLSIGGRRAPQFATCGTQSFSPTQKSK